MAAQYAPIKAQRYVATGPSSDTFHKAESRYWRSLKSTTFIKNYAAVTDLHFSLAAPHRFVVTSGTRLQLYTQKTSRVVKTISRFKDTARSGNVRDDGKLCVAGDDSGLVQVFDLASRAILRSIKDHSQPVHSSQFSPTASGSNPEILTACDDGTVRTFDLATAAPLSLFATHSDYVRAAAFLPSSPHLYLSGSYDATVKLWDSRLSTAEHSGQTMSFDHGHPVESLLVHPSGSIAISSGGPIIKIWDLLSGNTKRPLKVLSNHQKTVTSLCWGDSSQSRLLSAGLDGLVKSYSVQSGTWKVGHTMRFGGQLLAIALSPTDSTLAVGAADGTLSIRTLPSLAQPIPSRKAKALQESATLQQHQQKQEDSITTVEKPSETTWRSSKSSDRRSRPKLKEWDRLLKVFRYADALDCVMEGTTQPDVVVAVLDELKKLDGLKQALGSRNDKDLVKVLRFFTKQVTDPRWGRHIAELVAVLIELYERMLGRSPLVDKLFAQLSRRVDEELNFHADLYKVQGSLAMIFTTSLASSRTGIGQQPSVVDEIQE